MTQTWYFIRLLGLLFLIPLSACTYMSQTGPQKATIQGNHQPYELIEIKSRADIPSQGRTYGAGQIPPPIQGESYSDKIRERDNLRFVITDLTEQSPFYSRGEPFNFGPVEVPQDGQIFVPYVNNLAVSGRTLADVSLELMAKLKPISSTAQGAVTRAGRIPRTANVLGEVKSPGPVNLERGGMDSLDLLASSGGPREAEHLYRYTLRRGKRDYKFDYEGFRKRAFPIEEGDLLTVSTDSTNRFQILGAINRPGTIAFPVSQPTLADALGAASGLDERRSDPSGIFIFRKGNPDQVYTLNLKHPGAMLLAQRFPIRGEDIVYVTEAPLVRWGRLIQQIVPLTAFSQTALEIDRVLRNN